MPSPRSVCTTSCCGSTATTSAASAPTPRPASASSAAAAKPSASAAGPTTSSTWTAWRRTSRAPCSGVWCRLRAEARLGLRLRLRLRRGRRPVDGPGLRRCRRGLDAALRRGVVPDRLRLGIHLDVVLHALVPVAVRPGSLAAARLELLGRLLIGLRLRQPALLVGFLVHLVLAGSALPLC